MKRLDAMLAISLALALGAYGDSNNTESTQEIKLAPAICDPAPALSIATRCR